MHLMAQPCQLVVAAAMDAITELQISAPVIYEGTFRFELSVL